jgi:hypothetical protein
MNQLNTDRALGQQAPTTRVHDPAPPRTDPLNPLFPPHPNRLYSQHEMTVANLQLLQNTSRIQFLLATQLHVLALRWPKQPKDPLRPQPAKVRVRRSAGPDPRATQPQPRFIACGARLSTPGEFSR